MSKWQSERSIHEMLKDTPPIRECSDSITTGTEPKFSTSRSMTFPPSYVPPESTNGVVRGNSRLDALRTWSLATYKCTRQILYEKLGKTSRTVDTELEAQIENLRETQRRYASVLRVSRALAAQLAAAHGTQRALADAFAELAHRDPSTRPQFLYNADTQRTITRNYDSLLSALQFFNNALDTLTHRTMEDTLITIRQYEAARVEYDAYRTEAESHANGAPAALLEQVAAKRSIYTRLRDDAASKLTLLHDNRIKVMNKQLVLFHNAFAAFFSGNNAALEATVKQFSVKPPVNVNVTTNDIPVPIPKATD